MIVLGVEEAGVGGVVVGAFVDIHLCRDRPDLGEDLRDNEDAPGERRAAVWGRGKEELEHRSVASDGLAIADLYGLGGWFPGVFDGSSVCGMHKIGGAGVGKG